MSVRIKSRLIGPGHSVYVVAELSGNHNGDLQRAIDTVRAAAQAGADAIKLQTYTPDTITIDSNQPDFVVPGDGPWAGRTLYDLYREAHTPWNWHPRLFEEAAARGLDIFSTPFDSTAVDFLENLASPAYKVASFELLDDGLLERVAQTGKPVILSTGMANRDEMGHAVGVLRDAGCEQLVLLKCTSSYPAPDASMNLSSLPELSRAYECPVGLSDHSLGTTAPVLAVALGACMIEKHFTLSRADGGVDSHFSLEPAEFAVLVREVRRAEKMVGVPSFGPGAAEEGNVTFRRSLYVVRDVAKGEVFTKDNVRSIRPGFGLAPRHLRTVLGKPATRAVKRGTPMSWDLVANG